MDFGERLKLLRDENEITQDILAKHMGVGRPTIAGYETKGKQPSFEILKKLADFFNVSVDYLLGRTDIRQPLSNDLKPSEISELSKEVENLSPESKEDLRKYIELLKIKDMQDRNKNTEFADEISE